MASNLLRQRRLSVGRTKPCPGDQRRQRSDPRALGLSTDGDDHQHPDRDPHHYANADGYAISVSGVGRTAFFPD